MSGVLAAAQAQLVFYPNGAVAPFDPNNAAATKEHFAALAEAGSVVNPYNTHAQDLVVPHLVAPLYYGYLSYLHLHYSRSDCFMKFNLESDLPSHRSLELTDW